mgnify:FL=1|jgi:hypothetical protein
MITSSKIGFFILAILTISCGGDDNNNPSGNDPNDPNPSTLPKYVQYEIGPQGTNVQYVYNEHDLLEVWTETYPGFGFEITTLYNDDLNPIVLDYVDSQQVTDSKGFFYDLQGRVFRYIDDYTDVSLTYSNDSIYFNGMIDSIMDLSGSMIVDPQGKVKTFNGLDQYLTFAYDAFGNMTALNQYDNQDQLIAGYAFNYDNKTNPFYGQYTPLYLTRYIDLFWGFETVNFTGLSGYVFPYNPNNITAVFRDGANIRSYLIAYDNDSYPAIVSEIAAGNSYQYDITYFP